MYSKISASKLQLTGAAYDIECLAKSLAGLGDTGTVIAQQIVLEDSNVLNKVVFEYDEHRSYEPFESALSSCLEYVDALAGEGAALHQNDASLPVPHELRGSMLFVA